MVIGNSKLRCTHHFRELLKWKIEDDIVKGFIKSAGFEPILKLKPFQVDNAHITALTKRWHKETNTFHFPHGEMTVTLQDVQVLLGLRVNGFAVVGPHPIGNGDNQYTSWASMCDALLGIHPDGLSKGAIQLKWLRATFTAIDMVNADLEMKRRYSRAYLLYLLGTFLIPDSTGNEVHLRFLPFLSNFEQCGKLSWGSATLAWMYRAMSKTKKDSQKRLACCVYLLQLWSWERLHVGRSRLLNCSDVEWPHDTPLGYRWNGFSMPDKEAVRGSVMFYVNEGEVQLHSQIIWEPYNDVMDSLPEFCIENQSIWMAKVPMLCGQIMEWHPADRVLRQFGIIQTQPKPLPTYDRVDGKGRQNTNFMELYNKELEIWNDRANRLVVEPVPLSGGVTHDWYHPEYLIHPPTVPPTSWTPLAYIQRQSRESHEKIREVLQPFSQQSPMPEWLQNIHHIQDTYYNLLEVGYVPEQPPLAQSTGTPTVVAGMSRCLPRTSTVAMETSTVTTNTSPDCRITPTPRYPRTSTPTYAATPTPSYVATSTPTYAGASTPSDACGYTPGSPQYCQTLGYRPPIFSISLSFGTLTSTIPGTSLQFQIMPPVHPYGTYPYVGGSSYNTQSSATLGTYAHILMIPHFPCGTMPFTGGTSQGTQAPIPRMGFTQYFIPSQFTMSSGPPSSQPTMNEDMFASTTATNVVTTRSLLPPH